MGVINYISPEEENPGKGIGPEDNSNYAGIAVKQQGFLAAAFGLALGLTLVILYLLIQIPSLPASISGLLPTVWGGGIYSIIFYFVTGLIIGTLLAIIYNLLLTKRINLFGIDHTMD